MDVNKSCDVLSDMRSRSEEMDVPKVGEETDTTEEDAAVPLLPFHTALLTMRMYPNSRNDDALPVLSTRTVVGDVNVTTGSCALPPDIRSQTKSWNGEAYIVTTDRVFMAENVKGSEVTALN